MIILHNTCCSITGSADLHQSGSSLNTCIYLVQLILTFNIYFFSVLILSQLCGAFLKSVYLFIELILRKEIALAKGTANLFGI